MDDVSTFFGMEGVHSSRRQMMWPSFCAHRWFPALMDELNLKWLESYKQSELGTKVPVRAHQWDQWLIGLLCLTFQAALVAQRLGWVAGTWQGTKASAPLFSGQKELCQLLISCLCCISKFSCSKMDERNYRLIHIKTYPYRVAQCSQTFLSCDTPKRSNNFHGTPEKI